MTENITPNNSLKSIGLFNLNRSNPLFNLLSLGALK